MSGSSAIAVREQLIGIFGTKDDGVSKDYRISEIFQLLAPLSDADLAQIPPICLSQCTTRDRLAIKCLHQQFPSLSLTTTFPLVLSLVLQAMEEVKERARDLEGIFRLSRNPLQAEQLTQKLLQIHPDHEEEMRDFLKRVDPYDLAMMIKMFTRQAFPQLLTREILEAFHHNGPIIIDAYWQSLVPGRKTFLRALLSMIRVIRENEPTNKMNANNLARVFAPNFFQYPADPMVDYNLLPVTIALVQNLFEMDSISE